MNRNRAANEHSKKKKIYLAVRRKGADVPQIVKRVLCVRIVSRGEAIIAQLLRRGLRRNQWSHVSGGEKVKGPGDFAGWDSVTACIQTRGRRRHRASVVWAARNTRSDHADKTRTEALSWRNRRSREFRDVDATLQLRKKERERERASAGHILILGANLLQTKKMCSVISSGPREASIISRLTYQLTKRRIPLAFYPGVEIYRLFIRRALFFSHVIRSSRAMQRWCVYIPVCFFNVTRIEIYMRVVHAEKKNYEIARKIIILKFDARQRAYTYNKNK